MIIITTDFYSTALSNKHPDKLFVYGDNLARYGKGGQACIRDTPNSIGLATKYLPSNSNQSYFNDNDIIEIEKILRQEILNIISKGEKYRYIVFPIGGLGTGLSQLPTRAPKVYKLLCEKLLENFNIITLADTTLKFKDEVTI